MSFTFTGSLPPPAFADVLQGAAGSIPSTGRVELDKAIGKQLRPLGHEISLWHHAIGLLQNRHLKDRLPGGLAEFVGHWLPKEPLPPPPAEFVLLLGQNEHGIHLRSASVPFVRDAVWWALLQLPALRDAWTADLRASHFEHLLNTLPRAWFIDPAPLVPGSEIAGLGLGSWMDLDRLSEQGRNFEVHKLADPMVRAPLTDKTGIEDALTSRDHLLVEMPKAQKWWLARYGPRDGQLVLLDAHEGTATEAGWAIQKAALA